MVFCFQANVLSICLLPNNTHREIIYSTDINSGLENPADTSEEQEKGEEEYQETWEYINALNHYESNNNIKLINLILRYQFDFSSLIKDIPVPPPK